MITRAVPSGPNRLSRPAAAGVPSPSFTTAPSCPYAEDHHNRRGLRQRDRTVLRWCRFPESGVGMAVSGRCATDGGPAPFGPARDPPAAGRPGSLSTERPGPTRVTPPDRPERSLVTVRALSLAPSGGAPVRHTVPDSAAPRRVCGRFPGRASGGGLRRTYRPPAAACQQSLDLRLFHQRAGQRGGEAGHGPAKIIAPSAVEITRPAVRRRYGRPPRYGDRRAAPGRG